jgi:signal transduction histidine kinase/CheY-like chemotaxis protein/tetratricopeptide (TPR) repeat protein
MKRSILFFLFSISFSLAYTQGKDSLINTALDLMEKDFDSSIDYFNQSLTLETSTNAKLELYNKYNFKLFRLSLLDELLSNCNKALALPLSDSTYKNYSLVVRDKFQVFHLQKEIDSAIAVLNYMETLANHYQDTLMTVKVMRENASFLKNNGDITSSLNLLLDALAMVELTGEEREIAEVQRDLAIIYEKVNKSEIAISYNLKALETSKKFNDFQAIARTYNNIGLIYDELHKYDSAEYFYQLCYNISDSLGIEFGKAISKLNIGLAAYRKKEYQRSIGLYYEVLPFFERISDDFGVALCYLNLTRNYNDIGEYDKALALGKKGFVIAKEQGFVNEIRAIADELAELYEHKGLYKQALQFKKEEMIARDSLFNQDKDYEVGRLESKIDLDKARFENKLKDQENKLLTEETIIQEQRIRSQKILIAGAATIAILLLAIAILLRRQLKERKILFTKIEKQSKKLKELDHAKTRFFANISHDLRSPLTLILGSLNQIVERDYEIMDRESKELLDTGMKNGKRLLYLADEIMDLTRLEEGKIALDLQLVKVVPYMKLLTKMFSSAADIKLIRLQFSSDCDPEIVLELDPHQFEKIVYNLLSNAIKFTPEKGFVDVKVETENANVKIIVSDSGSGISADSIDLIFDRYYQSSSNSHSSQAGVGIGLALVKELVELHNGSIDVTTSKGGTTFSVLLPFNATSHINGIIPERSLDVVTRNSLWMDLQEEQERIQVTSLSNDSTDAKSVLIVEDHKELRFYLKSILSSDYKVFLANNGSAALEILDAENIDLIMTDLMMPYMDGFELIDRLKKDKNFRKIPVLVVSARTDKEEKIGLIKKGADDVISKPFDKDELIARITNILERDWDSSVKLSKLYGESAEEFEKSIMAKMERLIIKRIDDPHLTVLDLADEMAASERKVYRMIKKISGLTPYELIKEVRWQYLEKYLKNNKVQTATEAGNLIGMSNPSSLADQYKKRFNRDLKEDLK